jgi:TRAP-type C4-dicarboxylate transport system permease small subunit
MKNNHLLLPRIINFFNKIGPITGCLAILLMAFLITFEIISRALLKKSTLVSDEFSAYLLVMVIFLSLAHCMRSEAMLRVEFIFDRVSKNVQLWLKLFSASIGILFMVILTYECWMFVLESYELGYKSIMPSGIDLWIPQLVMPVGCFLLLIELFVEFLEIIFKIKHRNKLRGV